MSAYKTDQTAKKVDKTGAPFAMSWTNNRPLASSQGLTESPGGKLSPKELAGVGKGK